MTGEVLAVSALVVQEAVGYNIISREAVGQKGPRAGGREKVIIENHHIRVAVTK